MDSNREKGSILDFKQLSLMHVSLLAGCSVKKVRQVISQMFPKCTRERL